MCNNFSMYLNVNYDIYFTLCILLIIVKRVRAIILALLAK